MISKNWQIRGYVLIIAAIVACGAINLSAGNKDNAAFRVVKVKLRAKPMSYDGPCPTEIKFSVQITTTGGAGSVVCKILRSDNLPAPAMTIKFERSGTKDTLYSWELKDSFLGWQQLEIVEPNPIKSNQAEVSVTCLQ